ncbi:uncharacterized protein F5147DRAFT_524310, partial [Suillus discolor]
KVFNFQTYKFYALGDYVSTICQYGTSDLYSTEPGELEHRSPKTRYCRTDRNTFVKQLTQIEHRQTHIRCIRDRIVPRPHLEIAEIARRPHVHHHISLTQKFPVHIGSYLCDHAGDPAITNFVLKLKDHILHRFNQSRDLPGTGEETNINSIILKDDRMYHHNTARFNYTTYNVRRSQDVVNPRTPRCNIMVLRADHNVGRQGHRYIYGKVLCIYHMNVIFIGNSMVDYTPLRTEFLWVCWYTPIDDLATWKTSMLDCLCFPRMADDFSFDFLDPADVLTGCHIIPSFANGKKHPNGLEVSACAGNKDDWCQYYVNRFVNRDMLMHFHFGLGVGH